MPRRKQPTASQPANVPTRDEKQLKFLDNSLDDLKRMPKDVQKEVGFQLRAVQRGGNPSVPVKSLNRIGPQTLELIVNHKDGWVRVLYVAAFENFVYVLHVFSKKTNETPKSDVKLARKRYRLIPQQ